MYDGYVHVWWSEANKKWTMVQDNLYVEGDGYIYDEINMEYIVGWVEMPDFRIFVEPQPKITLATKIVFLDMDGVINSSNREYKVIREPKLHQKELINNLNGLSEIPDIKIVLTSVWRRKFNTPEKVNELFKTIGINLECIGVTPSLAHGTCRGDEIQQWVVDNIGNDYWRYINYAIIDDDSDMLYAQRNNFFLCDHSVGITSNIVYRVKNHFMNIQLANGV